MMTRQVKTIQNEIISLMLDINDDTIEDMTRYSTSPYSIPTYIKTENILQIYCIGKAKT